MTRATQARAKELQTNTKTLTAMFARLDELSEADANMHMAWWVLKREFDLSRRVAGQVVRAWMQEN
ncbi:MAG TPA: hypothetical protein VM537_01060 [Anaerolineae bacterium]|nr:hypothetical protein [Anaerolineae bacterium]